ncbi:MAG: hypothetical protein JSS87_08880 [Acidobacteria bacterium]|nr:hypothetical protein [Acidobacteriota bacterium]
MYRFSRALAAALSVALTAGAFSTTMTAQSTRRRRENATRMARIARNIQQTYSHKYDIFGGGGYLRFRSGEDLQRNNEVVWAVSATRNFTPVWGVVADVRGHYGNAKTGNNLYNVYNPLITHYTFMAGPQYRFYRKEKTAIGVHVLGGAAMGNFDGGTKGFAAYHLGMWDTATRPVISAGVTLDYNIYTNIAFRVMPTYEATMFKGVREDAFGNRGASMGNVQHNLGFNMGFVYRFGRQ